ncbi:hypothetical protein ACNKHN_09305 [Shigella flexneri]
MSFDDKAFVQVGAEIVDGNSVWQSRSSRRSMRRRRRKLRSPSGTTQVLPCGRAKP